MIIYPFLALTATLLGPVYGQERACEWIRNNSSCYYTVEHMLPFFSAETECVIKYGGHLVSINTLEENDFLTTRLLHKYGNTDGTSWWIGGFQNPDQDWTWVTGEKWSEEAIFWQPGQPNDGGDACAAIQGSTFLYKLWDAACTNSIKFICEKNL